MVNTIRRQVVTDTGVSKLPYMQIKAIKDRTEISLNLNHEIKNRNREYIKRI